MLVILRIREPAGLVLNHIKRVSVPLLGIFPIFEYTSCPILNIVISHMNVDQVIWQYIYADDLFNCFWYPSKKNCNNFMDVKEVKLTPKWNWWIEPKFTPLGELEAPLSQEAFDGKLL